MVNGLKLSTRIVSSGVFLFRQLYSGGVCYENAENSCFNALALHTWGTIVAGRIFYYMCH